MDLYQPLFVPRPIVEPELFASLRPPTYSGPLTSQFNVGQIGGFGGNFANNSIAQPQQMAQQGFNPGIGNSAVQSINPNNPGLNRFQNSINDVNLNNLQQQKLTFKDLQNRRNENSNKSQQEVAQDQQKAKQIGSILTGVDPDLIESALTAEELGNPARFVIEEKVSLPRQQSAMIPILEQPIDAARVSIYNQRVQAKHPLFGLKLKNNSKQSLMSGPITVYDDNQYAGDSRILDLQPGEERFISYAIDTGTEILPFDKIIPSPEMTVRMENGRLQVQYKMRTTRTYVIKNRSPESRKIVIEQPVREGWKFTEAHKVIQTAAGKKDDEGKEKDATWKAGDIEKPTERTRELYRFAVDVKPGETVKYEVSEELPRIDPFENTKQADWTGFATTLGLDVWTDSKRTPEDQFGIEIAMNNLKVTHKDRRTTNYYLKNRADVERTVWLEHFVQRERKLVGDVKPEGEDSQRYRFKLILPPGKTLSQTVVEEFLVPRPESFPMKGGNYTRTANDATELPADRFITDLGFEVWQTRKTQPDSLLTAQFLKGELLTTSKDKETVTYHIRNTAAVERSFQIDHHVRPLWSFVGTEKPIEGSKTCFRIPLIAGNDKMIKHDVTEEKTTSRKEKMESLNEDRVKVLLAYPQVSQPVKDSIRKGTAMLQALEQTVAALKESRAQVKEITDEQSRIKGNLERLPPTSELYKRLIDKFDKQETALEKAQSQIAEKVGEEKKQ
ncbi:MAG: hypothetical protein K8T89_03340, partial [Planctomycetes bacterium]|nr:hypothetical protein [Planctomycetota bacterium]